MRKLRKVLGEIRLELIAGFCDGILTALTLAAGRIVASASPISLGLALRVATAGASSSVFMFAVAHYAQSRGELSEAERQLNLTSHGKLANSRLGREVLLESAAAAIIGSASGFCGSLIPLLVGVMVPGARWLAIATALAVLAVLGAFLATTVQGRPLRWAVSLMLAGGALAYLGMRLRLI
jgi:predicted membrane protein (TIGR00267 family)